MQFLLEQLKEELFLWVEMLSLSEINSNPKLVFAIERLERSFVTHGVRLNDWLLEGDEPWN
jgi:hypothetical protein